MPYQSLIVIRALVILVAIIVLGAFAIDSSVTAYHSQHRGEHRDKLQRLLASHPTEAQLQQILGSPWQSSSTDEAVALAKQQWVGGQDSSISADIAQRCPRTLIYLISDMVYFIFLDRDGTMADFTLLYN